MSNSKKERENHKKKLEKKKLLLQMKKEVKSLEKQIKYPRLTNFKISSVKNLKISARALQLVAPYVLTAGIVAGGFVLSGNIPFYRDKKEIHSSIMTEFDNLGNIRYEQQYDDFENSSNVLQSYSQWQLQEDGLYSRIVKTYNVNNKTYEELIELFNKENLSLENLFGEAISTIKETKNNLSEDEINEKEFLQAVIYSEDEQDYIIRKETVGDNILFSVLYVALTALVETIPLDFRKKFSSFDFGECVENIKDKYKPTDIQELTRKLEIRRDNYNRMMR